MTQAPSFKNTILFILAVFFVSFGMLCVLCPDLWFYHNYRLVLSHETEIPMESTYILVAHFFHGGIQLWDRFDQMNNAFFACTNGIYGVANILSALIFILLSPFLSHPAESFTHLHMFLFYSLTCLIRIIGGYLLLRKFVSNKPVIFISLVYLSTLLTSYMSTEGLEQEGVYSFMPLLMYFILCFFDNLRLKDLLCAGLVMCLSLVSSPYFTLGYYYQAVHFFILSCLIAFIGERGWRRLKGREALPRVNFIKNMGLIFCCVLIVLPFYWWGHALTHDFYVFGSGLGGTQGRFNNILNFKGYFNLFNKAFANAFEYIGTVTDYQHNVWGTSWLFIGGSSLLFALSGIILSKDRRKFIFLGSIVCVVLINNAWFAGDFSYLDQEIKYAQLDSSLFWARGMHAHDWFSYGILLMSTLVHGINVLTNPFCFLVRSFHMASLLVPMFFLPLIAMGLESMFCLWQGQTDTIYAHRKWVLVVLFALILLWDVCGGTWSLSVGVIGQAAAASLRAYILSIASIFLFLGLIPIFMPQTPRWVVWFILGLVFLIEFVALMVYVRDYGKEHPDHAVPTRIYPSYTHQAVIPDYQNPRLLPLREFLNVQSEAISPVIIGGPLCMYGAFYKYTPIGRFFHKWSIYEPRHLSYKNLYPDGEIQRYLAANGHTIFFADYAFDTRYLALADILRLNLDKRVVIVEPDNFNVPFLKKQERVYLGPVANEDKFYQVSLDSSKAEVRKTSSGWLYTFDLPNNFPDYLSTSVFTYDAASWKLMIANRILEPMQGELSAPFTYDVQNIQEKKLTVLLANPLVSVVPVILQVKLPEHIAQVWKNTYDDLGITYDAPRAGWLVFNYPFDDKWELNIDGKIMPLSRVNRYFMGTPVTAGEHQILLRYWPHTFLRFAILLSMIFSCCSFGGIILYGLKQESRR